MDVIGIDFTSRPSHGKPLTCIRCKFDGNSLQEFSLEEWPQFEHFENALQTPGPWIAGVDFPFGQSRKFIENIAWPNDWAGYVKHAGSLGRQGFRDALDGYRQNRPFGDKEHRRKTDIAASSISPQKLFGVPVGLMFFEGAQRLLRSDVSIPGLKVGDPDRIVVEAYPGLLARQLIGRTGYKSDNIRKQSGVHLRNRRIILERILSGGLGDHYKFHVKASQNIIEDLIKDASGDRLDALLCAIQAAWSWSMRDINFGFPNGFDALEGWIATATE
ncbi:MAG TPA: hypothetical protein VG960_10460 [Caulobacteraceae bacterium]|nr:hypothetical protein [Caulobacteraceae bacterium]